MVPGKGKYCKSRIINIRYSNILKNNTCYSLIIISENYVMDIGCYSSKEIHLYKNNGFYILFRKKVNNTLLSSYCSYVSVKPVSDYIRIEGVLFKVEVTLENKQRVLSIIEVYNYPYYIVNCSKSVIYYKQCGSKEEYTGCYNYSGSGYSNDGYRGVSNSNDGYRGVSNSGEGYRGVSNSGDGYRGVSDVIHKQQGVSDKDSNIKGVNISTNEQQGVSDKDSNIKGVNISTNEQHGVSDKDSNIKGVNKSTNEQQGVNTNTNSNPSTQHPFNNTPFNNNNNTPNNNNNTHYPFIFTDYSLPLILTLRIGKKVLNYTFKQDTIIIEGFYLQCTKINTSYILRIVEINRLEVLNDINICSNITVGYIYKVLFEHIAISVVSGVNEVMCIHLKGTEINLKSSKECYVSINDKSEVGGVNYKDSRKGVNYKSELGGVSDSKDIKLEGVNDKSNKLEGVSNKDNKLEGVINSKEQHPLNNNNISTNKQHPL
ncbi:hypothetical protein LUQ84_001127 [Hamiltosporidium tvaerminnensis]|nr:hypothetical protein LUQ84_001127 [Hamiltosporidium tvaerminnensis]